MNEPFVIPVIYKDQSVDVQAQLITTTYSYQIQVTVDGEEVNFERDDEGNFRAIVTKPDTNSKNPKVNPQLLQLIAEKLEEILS